MADHELVAATLTAGLLQANIAAGGLQQALSNRLGGLDENAAVELYLRVLAALRGKINASP